MDFYSFYCYSNSITLVDTFRPQLFVENYDYVRIGILKVLTSAPQCVNPINQNLENLLRCGLFKLENKINSVKYGSKICFSS